MSGVFQILKPGHGCHIFVSSRFFAIFAQNCFTSQRHVQHAACMCVHRQLPWPAGVDFERFVLWSPLPNCAVTTSVIIHLVCSYRRLEVCILQPKAWERVKGRFSVMRQAWRIIWTSSCQLSLRQTWLSGLLGPCRRWITQHGLKPGSFHHLKRLLLTSYGRVSIVTPKSLSSSSSSSSSSWHSK